MTVQPGERSFVEASFRLGLQAHVAPGIVATLIDRDRLARLQVDFEAAGGQGALEAGGSGVVLLIRDWQKAGDAQPLPLTGLRLESPESRWEMLLVHECGWGNRTAAGAALLRLSTGSHSDDGPAAAVGLALLGPDRRLIASLPQAWLQVLADWAAPSEDVT